METRSQLARKPEKNASRGAALPQPASTCIGQVHDLSRRLRWQCDCGAVSSSTILAVDTEPDLLVTYYRLLTREGYRVVTATSRTLGLLALDREPPDLVIVTLSLRDGNGLDVIRAARDRQTPAAAILISRFSADTGAADGPRLPNLQLGDAVSEEPELTGRAPR
jgi:CheY-like chemotaxis protein